MEGKIECAHDELVDIHKLQPNPLNPNKHPEKQIQLLAKIIDYQGQRSPIVVSVRSGFITKGHGRLEAIKLLGWEKAAIDFQEYENEAQEYADMVADNKIAELAEHDDAFMIDTIGKLDLSPLPSLDLLGMPDFRLPEVLNAQCDEDEAPSAPKEPKTKRGDVYKLGRHKLICGDSTLSDDIVKLMGDCRADMVWTDPPYNVDYVGKTKDALTIQNDEMTGDKFYQFLYDSFTNMVMSTKAGGAIYVSHADSEGLNFRKAMIDSGWLMKQCLIWVKQSLVMGRQDYHWKHEPILYGWAPGGSHNWYSDRKQTTVLEFDRPIKSEEHPTMKPVELIEYCLNNSCAPHGTVLDPFGGSGSTLIACEKTGMVAMLCELDPRYCDVIVARWEKYTGKTAELING